MRSDLPDAVSQRSTRGHPNGPSKLNRFDVGADDSFVLSIQFLQPVPDGLSASISPIENNGNSFLTVRHYRSVPILIRLSMLRCGGKKNKEDVWTKTDRLDELKHPRPPHLQWHSVKGKCRDFCYFYAG